MRVCKQLFRVEPNSVKYIVIAAGHTIKRNRVKWFKLILQPVDIIFFFRMEKVLNNNMIFSLKYLHYLLMIGNRVRTRL